MPMPPPKASTEGPRDRQVFHEMGQIVRALEQQGPQTPGEPQRWSARRTGRAGGSTARSRSRSRTGWSSGPPTTGSRRSDRGVREESGRDRYVLRGVGPRARR